MYAARALHARDSFSVSLRVSHCPPSTCLIFLDPGILGPHN